MLFVVGIGYLFFKIVIWYFWVIVLRNFLFVVAIVFVWDIFFFFLFKKGKFLGKVINFVFWWIVNFINFFVCDKFFVKLGIFVIDIVVVI